MLIYALQRFKLDDWGLNTAFTVHQSQAMDKIEKHILVLDNWGEFTLQPSRSQRLAIKGRGTAVMDVSCTSLPGESMVAKLYWAEVARRSEVEIFTKVKEAERKTRHIKGHVPDLLLWCEFPLSTATVRQQLGFDNMASRKGSRKLRFLVFRKLQPIKELQGDELFSAWRQCVLCKFNCLGIAIFGSKSNIF